MRRPLRLPLSARLTLGYGLTLAVLLTLFAAFCYGTFHRGLHRDFDFHLAHETRAVRPFVVVGPDGPRMVGDERLTAVAIRTGGPFGTYVRLLGPDGAERYRSPNVEGQPPLPSRPPAAPRAASVSVTWGGLPARTAYAPLAGPDGRPAGWLEVTGFEWSLHQELDRLARTLGVGVVLGLVLALGGGYVLARRALRPVAALTESAARIGPADLGARLPAAFGVRDELSDLAETFNGYLDRLDAARERERRFTADAAHELQTPLASLRAEAEVALRRDRTPEAYRRALGAVLDDAGRLAAVVRGLLDLARAEREGAGEDVDLSAAAEAVVARARPAAAGKGVALTAHVAPGVRVRLPAGGADVVVGNLLDNAVKYTPPGGAVAVAVGVEAGGAVVRVEDTGVGFGPDEAGRLAGRFFRGTSAGGAPGSGLGLSVVEALARGAGGALTARSAGPGRGATFEVRLPAA